MPKKKVAVSLRRPPSPKAIDDFVAEAGSSSREKTPTSDIRELRPEASASASSSTPKQDAALSSVGDVVESDNGATLRPVTVYLPADVAEKLSLHCMQTDRDVSRLVAEALESHLQLRLPSEGSASSDTKETAEPFAQSFGGGWSAPSSFDIPAFVDVEKVKKLFDTTRSLVRLVRARFA